MDKKIFPVLICLAFLFSPALAAQVRVASVHLEPAPAIPGQYVDMLVYVENSSSTTAKNVRIVLDLTKETGEGTYPFSLDEGETAERALGSIVAGRTVTAGYRIRVDSEALNDSYKIKLRIYEEDQLRQIEEKQILIVRRRPQVEIIMSTLTEAAPGEKTSVSMTLRNVGNDSAIDLLAGLEEDRTVTSTGVVVEREIYPLGASSDYTERLAPGEETKVQLVLGINPDAEMKTYMVPIELKYEDSNANSYSETKYIGLLVYKDAEIDSTISGISQKPYPGGTAEITFDVFNLGIGDARYVVAELSSEVGKFETEKTFIGTLEADDFDSFKAKLAVNSSAKTGEHPINVTFSYKDQYEQPKTVSKTLPFLVYSAAEAQVAATQGIDIWFVVVVLIVLFFAGRWLYRKIRKK